MADRLEKALARLFLSLGILCDIEIKGTITTSQKSGSLAKPPFTTNYPCHRRDETDSWNYPQLEKFKACPVVNLRRIECIMGQIEIDEEKAAAFAKVKKRLDDEQKATDQAKLAQKNKPTRPSASSIVVKPRPNPSPS